MKTNNKPQPEIDNPLYSEETADIFDRASRIVARIALVCFLICVIGSIYKSTHAKHSQEAVANHIENLMNI